MQPSRLATARDLNLTSADRAAELEAVFAMQEQNLRLRHGWPDVVDVIQGTVADVGWRGYHGDMFPEDYKSLVLDSAIERLWRHAKRVFTFHPGMTELLADSAEAERVQANVFSRLPYTNPMIEFAVPPVFTLPSGQLSLFYGFYLYAVDHLPGSPRVRRLCMTDDDAAHWLGLLLVSRVVQGDGSLGEYELTRISVPLRGEFKIHKAIDDALKFRFNRAASALGPPMHRVERWLRQVLPLALQCALYICNSNADLADAPVPKSKPAKGKRKDGQRRSKPMRRVRAGYVIGPAMDTWRRSAAATARQGLGAGTGQEQDPHQRRGHTKRVWRGPRARAEEDYVYVLPYMVRLDLLGLKQVGGKIVPVRP